jgi:8-oxo-dGTP pyrophosphatase MutT (NUDIX family)
LNNKGKLIRAAVLVPIIIRDNGLHILLTKRNENLKNHAGQISFPGGRVDDTDRDAQHTALRETQEEIGLKPRLIKVIGELDQYVVGTGYLVNPFVGVIKPPFELIRQEDEVSEIFEVPLDFLINPANFTRYARMFNGETYYHHAITWENYFIWGATAGMLRNLSHRLLY